MNAYILSLGAGLISILSPCVYPMVPIIVGSSHRKNRIGPVAMAAGLILSFSILGITIGAVEQSLGLSATVLRNISGALLLFFGFIVFIKTRSESLQTRFSQISTLGSKLSTKTSSDSIIGNILSGVLLGVVWSPCIGPTLGSAVGLASQAGNISRSFAMMNLYGLGMVVPLLFVGYATKNTFEKSKLGLVKTSVWMKNIFSASMASY